MSQLYIQEYYNEYDQTVKFAKTANEDTIKGCFCNLLNRYADDRNLRVVREVFVLGTTGKNVKPDGILRNSWGLDIGYWESKDEKDSLDEEIDIKIKKGYPLTNILFEDSQSAVLFQNGQLVGRANVHEPAQLDRLIVSFIEFKREIIRKFEAALEIFKTDIPKILVAIRVQIDIKSKNNQPYLDAFEEFHDLCKTEINPAITADDIREMMIQHILTADIFNRVFDEPDFHRHNNIARKLEELIEKLFTYPERKTLLGNIEHFYGTIHEAASGIPDHHEKQKFLKVLYENFYKVYNPKAADRLGVVYTPNEIVKFMVESTDYLLHKHFGKTLASKNVEILDPATGTGTFICEIIEHIPKQYLLDKYKNELLANEVAILPYYIANLNIEYSYKQKMGAFEEFPNLCFVDTLDNTAALGYEGKQGTLFGISSENAKRICEQNNKKISVVIGNPPYNAKQPNYNYQNSNKRYFEIDKRIKDTYVKNGTAQTQYMLYDPYVRFFRWASDRINDGGIICFITNNKFLHGCAFNGFRKCIQTEFDSAYFIDLGGNIHDLSGLDGIFLNEKHTIFGVSAAVGISIAFLIKQKCKVNDKCNIFYALPCNIRATRKEKFEFLKSNPLHQINFQAITPDKNHHWIDLVNNDWEHLIPLIDKLVKSQKGQCALFKTFSLGIETKSDHWMYDYSSELLKNKVKYFIEQYEISMNMSNISDSKIKFNVKLDKCRQKRLHISFNHSQVSGCIYRPFTYLMFYCDKYLTGRTFKWSKIRHTTSENKIICISGSAHANQFLSLSSKYYVDLNCLPGGCQNIPLFRFDEAGNPIDNLTDWGLKEFQKHYKDKTISREQIFHYCYAVLHNPAYRKKYAQNLKCDFPRIPFYKDFSLWSQWGKQLMELHIGFEAAAPFGLQLVEAPRQPSRPKQTTSFPAVTEPGTLTDYVPKLKVKLKADKEHGTIELDEMTSLTGIPAEAWEYKLGNRSALEWILDQYKEKKPSDPTIAELFNTYRFADYKDKVIDLLQRVCTVSVETMKIVHDMENSEDGKFE